MVFHLGKQGFSLTVQQCRGQAFQSIIGFFPCCFIDGGNVALYHTYGSQEQITSPVVGFLIFFVGMSPVGLTFPLGFSFPLKTLQEKVEIVETKEELSVDSTVDEAAAVKLLFFILMCFHIVQWRPM